MTRRNTRLLWLVLMACGLGARPAASADRGEAGVNRQSRQDARDLAALAPPAPPSTRNATYGDAQLVRPRPPQSRRRATRDLGADAPLGLFVCPGRRDGGAQKLCIRDPRDVGFRRFYVYAPAYATSPQVPRDGLGRETSLLPPATRFFYSANAFLFGNPADE